MRRRSRAGRRRPPPPRGRGKGVPGPRTCAASARGPRRRRARRAGSSGAPLSLSRRGSPGNVLQLHLFCIACLTEHPKQFQDYISLSHLFARGVSQAREAGCPAAPCSLLHTRTQTHTEVRPCRNRSQGHLETHGGHEETHNHARAVDTRTRGPRIRAAVLHSPREHHSHRCYSRAQPFCAHGKAWSVAHTHRSTPSATHRHPESQSPWAKDFQHP